MRQHRATNKLSNSLYRRIDRNADTKALKFSPSGGKQSIDVVRMRKHSFDIHKQSNRMLIFPYKNQMNANKFTNARSIQPMSMLKGPRFPTHILHSFSRLSVRIWNENESPISGVCASGFTSPRTGNSALNPNTAYTHTHTLTRHYYSILF